MCFSLQGVYCVLFQVLRRPLRPVAACKARLPLGLPQHTVADLRSTPLPAPCSFDEFGRPRRKESAADREAREKAALDRLNVSGWLTPSLKYCC